EHPRPLPRRAVADARRIGETMQPNEPDDLNPADRELEQALKSLLPTSASIDPIAAAFSAGRRSATIPLRTWQSAAAAMLLIAAAAWMTRFAAAPTRPAPGVSPSSVTIVLPSAPDRPLPDQS